MVKDSTARRQWIEKTKRQLRGHRRRGEDSPHQAVHADAIDPATPADISDNRHASRLDPRQQLADRFYVAILSRCMSEPNLRNHLWMRCPAEGEHWMNADVVPVRSPIGLPDEVISAAQFAAEWALLWGESLSWAFSHATMPLPEDDPEHQEILAMTAGQTGSIIRFRGSAYETVEIELRGNLPSTIIAKWWREAWDEIHG